MIFLIMALTPGDPASNILPLTAKQSVKDAFNESVGFTGGLPTRFGNYIKGLFTGNIISYSSGNNVFSELQTRIPTTLSFGLLGFCISAVIGVALGILSAIRQYSFLDTTVTIFAVLFASIPSFFVAICLILLFSVNLGVLPSFGGGSYKHFILPILTLVLANIPILSRMTRSCMLDAMNQDYIRTARAKGCSETRVIWKHALKNACMPIITLLLTGLASVIGGAVIVEQIFTLPGIGMYLLHGISEKNVTVVMTSALLMSFIYMVAMVLLDMFYAMIDPKIRERYKK